MTWADGFLQGAALGVVMTLAVWWVWTVVMAKAEVSTGDAEISTHEEV